MIDVFELQKLEDRLLLSANTGPTSNIDITQATSDLIESSVTQLVKLGQQIELNPAFSTQLTGVGKSLADLFDIGSADGVGGFLGTKFAKPLADFMNPTLNQKAADITTFLSGLGGGNLNTFLVSVSNVTGGYYAATNEFEWQLTLKGQHSSSFTLLPGSDLATEHVSFGDVAVDISAEFNFTFSFGAKANGTGFFVTLGDVKASAKADTGNNLNFAVQLSDSVGVKVANGSLAVNAGIDNVAFNVTRDAKGRVSLSDLSALASNLGSKATIVGKSATLAAKLPLDIIGTGFPTVFIDAPDLFTSTTPDVTVKYLLTDPSLQTNILTLLGDLDGKVSSMTGDALFSQQIPLLNKSLGDLVPAADLSNLLTFKSVAQAYFTSAGANAELFGLVDALTTHVQTYISNASAGITGLFDAAKRVFTIDFTLDSKPTLTQNVKIDDFGQAAAEMGLELSDSIQLNLTGHVKADFSLGIDLSKGLPGANDFFLKVDEISVAASASLTGIGLGVNVGPIGASITGGTVNLSVKGEVKIADANSDSRITISELMAAGAISVVPSGSFDVNLPLTMAFGGYDFKVGSEAPRLHFSSSNPLQDALKVDITTPNFSRLFNLGKMGPEEVLDLMIAAGDFAGQFRDSSLFDIQIPFLDNVDLGDAFDFGLLFAKNLKEKLSTNEVSILSKVATINLTTATPFVISIPNDAANTKTVVVPAGNYSTSAAFAAAINSALTTAYGANPPVTAVVDVGSDKKAGTADDRVQIQAVKPDVVTDFAMVSPLLGLTALGFYSGSTTAVLTAKDGAPTNGKLTADAKVTFSIDGSNAVPVTITKASTDNNTSVADLVSDIQAALFARGITNITAGTADGKLVFTGGAGVTSFLVAGTDGSAFAELGLQATDAGGVGTVGSIQQTGPKFSTFQELVPLLAQALGIPEGIISPSYDPATETIKLHVKFDSTFDPIQVPVGFNLDLGSLGNIATVDASGNPAPFTIKLTPKLNAELDFGYTFKSNTAIGAISVVPDTGYVSPAGYDQSGAKPTPNVWNGQLTGDATFKITLDNAVERTITVAKSATTTNTSVADLVADINAAIAASSLNGKLTASVVAADATSAARVQFTTTSGVSRTLQVKAAKDSAAYTDLGFAEDTFNAAEDNSIMVVGEAGKTVKVAPGRDITFKVSVDGATPVTITLAKTATDGNTSFADLLVDLNSAISTAGLSTKLIATRVGATNRIELSTLGDARTLRVDPDANATDIGFGDAESFFRRKGGEFFIDNAKLAASATISVDDLRLSAQIGFLGIRVGDSSGSLTLGLTAELKEASGNKHFEIGSLFKTIANGGITSVAKLTPTGSADFKLTNITVDAGLFTIPTTPEIGFVVEDLFAANLKVTPSFKNMPSLTNFTKLDFATIFNGIKQGIAILSNYDQFAFLKYKLPIINLSPVEILDYAEKFKTAIDEIQENPTNALKFVEAKLEEVLGLPPNLLTLSVGGSNYDVIKISFNLEKTYANRFGLDLDLNDLSSLFEGGLPAGLQTISGLLDASAQGNIDISAYANAKLELGIDLSGASAKTFLYDTSGVEFGVRLAGRNLSLNANIGPVGLAVNDGFVLFDSDGKFDVLDKNGNAVAGGDGVIDDDYATIRIGLKDNDEPGSPKDGRHYLTESFTFADDFEVTYKGQFAAEFPAALITPLGNIDLDKPISLTTAAADFKNLINRAAGTNPIKIIAPNIKDLLPEAPGLIQLLRDPSILLDGIDGALFKIQSALDSQTSQKLPLIGDRLAEGAQVIENFRDGFLASLTEKLRGAGDNIIAEVRQTMFNFLNTAGLLQDYNGDGQVSLADVVLSYRKVDGSLWVDGTDDPKLQDALQFNLKLGQKYTAAIPDLGVDFGVPGLDLKITGSPSVSIGWDFFLGFGVSVSDYFYLDTKPTTNGLPKSATNQYVDNELEVNFDVKLTSDEAHPFTATGTLFFLQLAAKDAKLNADNGTTGTTKYSYFNGKFAVNLQDTGTGTNNDGRLTFPEIFRKAATPAFAASLSAVADINLALDLSVQGSKVLPRLLADFNLDWAWTFGQATQTPKVGFNNVKLDLGSFISDFLGPIAQKINDIIKPFDPVLNALQTRIPVLSDLLGRDYTLLDLAAQFGKVDRRFIDAAIQIRGLIGDIATAAASGQSILIDIGSLVDIGSSLMKKGGAKGVDPSGLGISTSQISVPSSAPASAQSVISKATSVTGGGFAFPILKPANAFKLLLGQDATLFTYDIPRLEFSMSMSYSFPIYPPLFGKFSGSISAFADFAVGFDTAGLNSFKVSGDPLDILGGFYVSDRANADGTGADVPEAGLKGRISIGGELNLGIARGGIEGFFELSANLDLNDPNDDGKIRGSEIAALLTYQAPNGNYYGPLNLASITLKGEVGARAYVDLFAIFSWANVWEYEFFRTTIFETTFSAPRPVPQIGSVSSGGVLELNAGANSKNRVFGSTTDVGEEFTFKSLANGSVEVTFVNTNTVQTYSGVTKIKLDAGKGNDKIDASKVNLFVELYGGEGDDELIAGSGGSYLDGGVGNDILTGGTGNDTLIGGLGADTISGGDGDDMIEGGDGRDDLSGGKGHDTFRFKDNWGADVITMLQSGNAADSDVFDFGGVTASTVISVSANLTKITSGKNSLTAADSTGEISKILGGSGTDQFNINATSAAGITVDGGKGADTYILGMGRFAGTVNIKDSNGGTNENDLILVTPLTSAPINVYDNKLVSDKGAAGTELVNFDDGIESLTIDGTKNVVTISEALDMRGDIRLKALTAMVTNPISGSYIRVDSINSINIAADLNSRRNGNVEIVVAKGDIQINANVFSTNGSTHGDGSGVVQLISRGGQISADGTGTVRADDGYLLLQGSTGSIGNDAHPILTQVRSMAAVTTGTGTINIREADGLIVDEVAIIKGITSNGGNVTITNLTNNLEFDQPVNAKGGDMTFETDQIQINASITSATGDLVLQPVHTNTPISIGDGTNSTFALNVSEIGNLTNGLNTIKIGREDGTHRINISDITFNDPTYIRNPILGGRIVQTGTVTVGDNASFNVLGSGHTMELDDQNVASNINILDSAVVREGESIRLQSSSGNININFDVDGTAGGAGESLTLNAQGGSIVVKGNIGSLAKLENLIIENATAISFEGSVNVGTLTIKNSPNLSVGGTVTADNIDLQTVGNVSFNSSVSATANITNSTGTLGTVAFKGNVTAAGINLTATTLLDFYQNVTTTTGNFVLKTTGLAGDIVLRQQVNVPKSVEVTSLDDITFSGPVTAGSVTVHDVNDLAFQGALNLTGALLQESGTGVATFASVSAQSISVTASSIAANSSLTSTGTTPINLTTTGTDLSVTSFINAAAGLNVTTARNAAFQGLITATTGNVSLISQGNGAITLAGAVSVPAGTLSSSGAATFGVSSALSARAADITARDFITISNSAAVTLQQDSSFRTTSSTLGEIRFTGTLTETGNKLTLSSARPAVFLGAVNVAHDLEITNSASLQFQDTLSVTGNFTATSTGAATFNTAVSVGKLNLTAGTANFSSTLVSTGDQTFSLTGALTAGGNVTSGGLLTVSQAASVAFNATTLADKAINVTAGQTILVGTGGITSTTGGISFTTTVAGSGNGVAVNGPLSAALQYAVNTARSVSITSTVDAQSLAITAVNVAAQNKITTAAAATFTLSGDLTTQGELNVGTALAVTQARDVSLTGAVKAATVSIDSALTRTVAFGSAGLTATTSVTINAPATGASVTFGGVVSVPTGELKVTTVGAIAANAATNVKTLTESAAGYTFTGSITADQGTVTVLSNKPAVFMAAVAVKNDLAVTNAASLQFQDTVSVAGKFTASATGAASFNTAVSVGQLDLTAGSASFASTLVSTGDQVFTITGALAASGNVTSGGALTVNQAATVSFNTTTLVQKNVNVTAAQTILVGTGGINSTVGSISFTTTQAGSGNGVTVNGPLDAALQFNVQTARSVALNSTAEAQSLAITAINVVAQNRIITDAAATFTLTGDLSTQGELSVGTNLLVAQARDVSFAAAVRAIAVNIDSALTRTVSFGNAGLTATTGITINAPAAGASITFNGPLIVQTGELKVTTVGAVTSNGSVAADTISGVAASFAFNGPVVTDSTVDTALGIVLDSTVAGAGSVVFASSLNSSQEVRIGRNRSVGSLSLGGTAMIADHLAITAAGAVITNGALSSTDLAVNAGSFNGGNSLTATVGGATFALTGNLSVSGATSVAQALLITNADAVTFTGALSATTITDTSASFLAGNTLTTTTGAATFTSTGNIRVVGLATIATDLLINAAANVTFQGQLTVTNQLRQVNGSGNTRLEGFTEAASINVKTAQQFYAGSTLRAKTGDIVIQSDEIDFVGGTGTVQGTGEITLLPYLASTSIDIGSPTPGGTLDLSDIDINALRDSFTQINIGLSGVTGGPVGTGAMVLGSSVFKDNLNLYAGSITAEANTLVGQQFTVQGRLNAVAATGNIIFHDDVDATQITLTAKDDVQVDGALRSTSTVLVTAGSDTTGSILFTNAGLLSATGNMVIKAGTTSGNINLAAGSLASGNQIDLQAVNGAITQTGGNTKATTLVSVSKTGLTLFSTLDHLNARVTGTGDLTVTDTASSPLHTLDLGTMGNANDVVSTADGNLTINSNANVNANNISASKTLKINTPGDIFIGSVSAASTSVTGTALLDSDRITNGQNINFDGNIRLLRDITFSTAGGNIRIAGAINGTVGQQYTLTLDSGAGDIMIGGTIGEITPLKNLLITNADSVTFGDEATDLASIRVSGNISITAAELEFNSPQLSVVSTGNGTLTLAPQGAAAAIDLGSPAGSAARFSLSDEDLATLGNGFSSITIGQAGGTHAVSIESAQFRDSLVVNGGSINLLTSATPQAVSGVSVLNASDDNSITFNAGGSFTQGRLAAITAGRLGNISITADAIELDAKDRNTIRGNGALILQPTSTLRSIVLGTDGTAADFALSAGELGALADGFTSVTIGRADGQHAIVIDASVQFRDNTVIQAPVNNGSITVAAAATPISVQTVGRTDNLTFRAGGNITVDGNLATTGSGTLNLLADVDANGVGDLLLGQNLTGKLGVISLTTETGALTLSGENVLLGKAGAPVKNKVPVTGAVHLVTAGSLRMQADVNGNGVGTLTLLNAKSTIVAQAGVTLQGAVLSLTGGAVTTKGALTLTSTSDLQIAAKSILTATRGMILSAMGDVSVGAAAKLRSITASITISTSLVDAGSSITLGAKANLNAKTEISLTGFTIDRASAILTAPKITVDDAL